MTDAEIRTADPEDVIRQYKPLVCKIANRYRDTLDKTGAVDIDDLIQAGMIAIVNAQKNYRQEEGSSFLHFSIFYIQSAIRRTLGIDRPGANLFTLVYLDDPINVDEKITIMDTIPDPSIPDNAEKLADDAEREERSTAVHEAVDRLKNHRQREVITRMYFQGQNGPEIAAATGIPKTQVYMNKDEALRKLRKDWRLKRTISPSFSTSLGSFREHMASVEERIVIWKEEQAEQFNGPGAYMRKSLTEEQANEIRSIFEQERLRKQKPTTGKGT